MRPAIIALALAAWLTPLPARARPGGSFDAYKAYLANSLKLKRAGVKHVEGGASSDWLYTFTGKSGKGLPLEATVQVGGKTVYSQALTMTARSTNQADATEVARLALQFWQEATGSNGKTVERDIAHQIQRGAGEASVIVKGVVLTLSRVPAGEQTIWVAGAEKRYAQHR